MNFTSRLSILAMFASLSLLSACANPLATSAVGSSPLVSAPQDQNYFRTCRARYGPDDQLGAVLNISGSRGILYVGVASGIPAEKLTSGNLLFWQETANIYKQSTWLARSDQSIRYHVRPVDGGDSFMATTDDPNYSLLAHWPIHFLCDSVGKKTEAQAVSPKP